MASSHAARLLTFFGSSCSNKPVFALTLFEDFIFSSRGQRKFRVICKGLLASLPTYLDHNQNLNRIPNSYKQQYSNLILHGAVRARPGRIFSFPRHSCGAIRTAMLSTRSVASNCCNLIVDFIS